MDFQNVYDDFQPQIRRFLCRLVGPDEAEDLTQDVFVKISQALPAFRNESTLSTWMCVLPRIPRSTDCEAARHTRPKCLWIPTTGPRQHPLGATMVSSEGACAAYYRYRRIQTPEAVHGR